MSTMRDWTSSAQFGKFVLTIGATLVVLLIIWARAASRLQQARRDDPTIPDVMDRYGLVDAREIVGAGEPRTAPAPTNPYTDVCQRAFGDDPTPRGGPTVTHLADGVPLHVVGDTSPSQLPRPTSG